MLVLLPSYTHHRGPQWPVWRNEYTVSQKNDTNVTHYNFNAHQPISLIFGVDIAE